MTAAEVERFFDAYADAFSQFDVDRICAMWAYPAFMAGRGKRAALDEAAFRANTQALCAFYKTQGLAQARKRVVTVDHLTPTVASVVTEDVLTAADGSEIAAWRHAYLVSETDQGVRVIAALPENELDAWSARGVRLGTW